MNLTSHHRGFATAETWRGAISGGGVGTVVGGPSVWESLEAVLKCSQQLPQRLHQVQWRIETIQTRKLTNLEKMGADVELERRINAGVTPLLFVCMLVCLLLYDSPYRSGCPSRRETGKVCNNSTSSVSSNGEEIAFKTILKLIIVKANISCPLTNRRLSLPRLFTCVKWMLSL